MTEDNRVDEIAERIITYAAENLDAIFAEIYPEPEIGYVFEADEPFFTCWEANVAHGFVHDYLFSFAKFGQYESDRDSINIWEAILERTEKFIEALVGTPEDRLVERFSEDKLYIENKVHEIVSRKDCYLSSEIGCDSLDKNLLCDAIIRALWRESYNFDQTVPASMVTEHDTLTMVFKFPADSVSDYLTRNIGSGRGLADALAVQWSKAGPGAQPILALRTCIRDILAIPCVPNQTTAVRFSGGGVLGYLRDDALFAAPFEGEFTVDPSVLVACTDKATRQVAAERLQNRDCARLVISR